MISVAEECKIVIYGEKYFCDICVCVYIYIYETIDYIYTYTYAGPIVSNNVCS